MGERAVCHLNIIGFRAAVAAIKDKSLQGRPYVIAGATGGRSLALDCSPEAIKQGITPGMALAVAEKRVKDLTILPPDVPAYSMMNSELERVVSVYAPVWENDCVGNLYLDITGTTRIFGPPCDCSSRILREILEQTDIKPAGAVASNKLVSKVATRTIRPTGLIKINNGTEAEFLSHQNVKILPGIGPKLMNTAAVTGIREIGEIAALSTTEALALFGKQGPLLRDMALGIDSSRVEERSGAHRITRQADFDADTIEEAAIKGAMETLVENGGLAMRNEKMGMRTLRLMVRYSDGVEAQGFEKTKRPLVTDSEIMTVVYTVYKKTVNRRLRLRSIGISFEDLSPLGYQPDLFEPETETKDRKLQEAVDRIQNRYGTEKISRGLVLASSSIQGGKRLLTTGSGYAN
ncbi:MAG: DNA polymerase [Treponema sp.]|jgi:DNA polymerase-4|nr:DNA polymerase [Treponema sp.]